MVGRGSLIIKSAPSRGASRDLGFLWTRDWGSTAARRRCPDKQIKRHPNPEVVGSGRWSVRRNRGCSSDYGSASSWSSNSLEKPLSFLATHFPRRAGQCMALHTRAPTAPSREICSMKFPRAVDEGYCGRLRPRKRWLPMARTPAAKRARTGCGS